MHCVEFEAKILHKSYIEPYMGTKSQRDKERKSERVKERKAKKNLRKAKNNLRKGKKNLRKANFNREPTPTPP